MFAAHGCTGGPRLLTEGSVMNIDYCTVGAFVAYLALMLGIGAFFSAKANSLSAFFLGGRQMNKWVVALSAQASDMSGWLLMGLPGAIFLGGFSEVWIGIGLLIGTYLNWKIVARRLRIYSHLCKDSITIPDFISNRFRDKVGLSRWIAALVILVFFTPYTASGFVSAAKLFTVTFGIPYLTALWIGAAVVLAYTLLGGYMAVCWTDFIQGSLMFIAVVLVPLMVIFAAGGFTAAVNDLNVVNPYLLNLFANAGTKSSMGMVALLGNMAWGLGYFGMAHILVRFMSIDSPVAVKGSRRIAMTWVTISLAAAAAIGLFGHLFLAQHPDMTGAVQSDPEKIFIIMINTIFGGSVLSRIFAGVLLSSILAAIMSTADSQLLVSASSFSADIYKHAIRKKAGNQELVVVSRLTVFAVAIVAAFMASNQESEFFKVVMQMVSFAWAGFGAAFGPVILLALFWKRCNLGGAISGMVVGAMTVFVWKLWVNPTYGSVSEWFTIYELAPGFVLGLIATVLGSLLTPAPSAEVVKEFEKAADMDNGPKLEAETVKL